MSAMFSYGASEIPELPVDLTKQKTNGKNKGKNTSDGYNITNL